MSPAKASKRYHGLLLIEVFARTWARKRMWSLYWECKYLDVMHEKDEYEDLLKKILDHMFKGGKK